ncbi:hypothetical protein P171DRAFT_252294 [Karstenula rhodostoma CBS 690.94]|uniref:SAC3/GANP/THP3 conserved domain-containing protein n=1 Tax=Karstenula rhodostoma CBS 690.94 TaxID=1392251 RepID=A0A9P4PLF0_9PLEO|nr:hypothetical protein P171DRAFT_252294 [Karstenula rhodostoma CBS 690.94]
MDPDGQMDMSQSVDKHGLCEDMCPEYERVRRIVQNDVAGPEHSEETAHGPRLQREVDEARMIAAHHRSSAGEDLTLMTDLRTPAALQKSMETMIDRLQGDSFEYLDGWIWDRSRAVRVELSKNYRRREDTESFLRCYEMCIRFHLLSMHQMLKRSKGVDYDRHTDWEQLAASCNQIKELWDKIKVYVPEDGVTPSPLEASRVAEIHAYNIILGLKERDHREEVRRHPRVKIAQALVRAAHDTKNYAAFWRMVQSSQVSYLMACAAATRFMSVRSDTLEAMVKGYMVHKQKVDDWTLEKLVNIFGFDDEDQVRTFCQAYGGEFETNAQGVTYLRPETITMRKDPFGKNHFFSQKYVESKRGGRNLAAVLFGYNMLQARQKGLMDPIADNDGDSLFIPESRTLSVPSAPSNPFAAAAAAARTSAQPSTMFPSGIQPGLFDASKNSVKFAPTPNNAPSTTAPANPFASVAAKLNVAGQSTTPAAGFPSVSTGFSAPATTASPALSAQAKPFAFLAGQKALGAPAAANGAGASAPGASVFSTPTASSNAFTGFTLPGSTNSAPSSAPTTGLSAFATSSAPSATSIGLGTPAAGLSFAKPAETTITPPTEDQQRKTVEEEQRKAEEARQKAQEDERRKAQEEQRRRAEEEQRRKVQEEQAKARVAEQQRRVREEKERERLRAQQEAARQAETQRRQALEALTTNLFEDPRDGMMKQFLENMVESMFNDTKAALRKERQALDDARADEMWQRRRLNLARAAFYRWAQHVHKKRRRAEARQLRDRRRKLKAEIEAAKSSAASSAASPPAQEIKAVAEVPVDQPVTLRPNSLSNGVSRRTQHTSQPPAQPDQRNGESSTRPILDFSQSYYEARAQSNERRVTVDRTETDYFRLRAMGIDPNKLRKRSYDSSDEEDAQQADNKRARTSSSSTGQQALVNFRKSLPPPTTDEERIARFRAIKESMAKKRSHTPSRSVDFNSSRMSTFNASTTSQIIQRARETLAQFSPSRQSTLDRSFARSTGTPLPSDKPAYWGRQSRFVPQHLYGQPEAIRAYRAQVAGRSPAGSQASPGALSQEKRKMVENAPEPPGFLSSPVPAQQSYFPTQQGFDVDADVVMLGDDADGEDEGGEGEFDDYSDGDEELEGEEGEFYSGDEDEEDQGEGDEYSEDEDGEEFAQQPGGNEHDAIELSD